MKKYYQSKTVQFLFQNIKVGIMFFTFSLFAFSGFSQAKTDRKISLLLSGQNDKSIYQKLPRALKMESVTVLRGEGEKPIEVYECIVYTKNSVDLKRQNIIINSVNPQFVTAMATIEQINLMVKMPEVTQVQAPVFVESTNGSSVLEVDTTILPAEKFNNPKKHKKHIRKKCCKKIRAV